MEYIIAINSILGVANLVGLFYHARKKPVRQITRVEYKDGIAWADSDGMIINSTTEIRRIQ